MGGLRRSKSVTTVAMADLSNSLHLREDDEVKYTPPGGFQRGPCKLQHWVEPDSQFVPEPGRYHLFVNYGCGWCHQLLMTRSLKGLEEVISISHIGFNNIGKRGTAEYKGWYIGPWDSTGNNFESAHDVYNSNLDYGNQQLTIPILFDLSSKQVVSNDPAQITLMLNSSFEQWAERPVDLYPSQLRRAIEDINDVVYPGINDGVYRCWFAGDEDRFTAHSRQVQDALQWVNTKLEQSQYLCGDQMTLADVRAFAHVFRFDVIYRSLMLREQGLRVAELPHLVAWMQRMFENPRIAATCDLQAAAWFYLMPQVTQEACDEMYSSCKCDWMPSILQLQEKRKSEHLDDYITDVLRAVGSSK